MFVLVNKRSLGAAGLLMLTACHYRESGRSSAERSGVANLTDAIQSAQSAAPAAIARNAAVVTPDGKKTLRQGSNGWTCMPDDPRTAGIDARCMDANATQWMQAWAARQPPPNAAGVMYMLASGSTTNQPGSRSPLACVLAGAHVMIVGSKEIVAEYPGGPKPGLSGPWVMSSGTPYAHLIIPVGEKAQ